MSILIKELHLPTERLYPLHLTIYSDGSVFCGHGIGKRSYEAVEVPVPHGRLVDLDVLEAHGDCLSKLCVDYDAPPGHRVWRECVPFDDIPTIIPAEEETP